MNPSPDIPAIVWAVVHVSIAVLTCTSTVLCAFLANRRIQADRRDNGMRCGECKRIELELRDRARLVKSSSGNNAL